MIPIALTLFVLSALGGLFLASRAFAGRTLPRPVAVLHGLLGVAGLVVLGLAVFGLGGAGPIAASALGLLVVAAFGGLVLLLTHRRRGTPPRRLIVIHGLLAPTVVVVLVVAMS